MKLKEMISEIEIDLKENYVDVMWANRIVMFFDIIKKHYDPDLIIDSYFLMKLMDLKSLEYVALENKNKDLMAFCEYSKPKIHAESIGWLVSKYMKDFLYKSNK